MIAERLAAIRAEIPASVTLIAVSKGQSPERIREAHAAGQRHFGENYAQEWRVKAEGLADLRDLEWHFIGALQSNKAKYLAGRAAWIHTLDREELAVELSRKLAQAGATMRALIQVSIAGEAQKAGCNPTALPELFARLQTLPGLEVVGLTCIPPAEGDPRSHFTRLRELRDALPVRLPHLSMGMSGDYAIAIEEGATLIRVGTAIFGPRIARSP